MSLTVKCVACGRLREVSSALEADPLCSADCAARFEETVRHLRNGGTLSEFGVDPDSELGRRAVSETLRLRRADRIEARDFRESQYERNRPRKLPPLYPI